MVWAVFQGAASQAVRGVGCLAGFARLQQHLTAFPGARDATRAPLVCLTIQGEPNMKEKPRHALIITLTAAAIGFAGSFGADAAPPPPAKGCPQMGWAEGLNNFLKPDHAFPTEDTRNVPTPDCNFHQWSWEAFVWATALIKDSVGRHRAAIHDAGHAGRASGYQRERRRAQGSSADARRPFACIPWRAPDSAKAPAPSSKPTATCWSPRTAIRSMPRFT